MDVIDRKNACVEDIQQALIGYDMPTIMSALAITTGGMLGMASSNRQDMERLLAVVCEQIGLLARDAFTFDGGRDDA